MKLKITVFTSTLLETYPLRVEMKRTSTGSLTGLKKRAISGEQLQENDVLREVYTGVVKLGNPGQPLVGMNFKC
jgi:hypothetical protein